ncbi:hypothetical protein MesoLj131c_31100 [Mesorhizobium sp. 131-3-5]|nr:hypothetical protein MesoLj131c_31100 [Mesorhizobium sp. 131-3-5]
MQLVPQIAWDRTIDDVSGLIVPKFVVPFHIPPAHQMRGHKRFNGSTHGVGTQDILKQYLECLAGERTPYYRCGLDYVLANSIQAIDALSYDPFDTLEISKAVEWTDRTPETIAHGDQSLALQCQRDFLSEKRVAAGQRRDPSRQLLVWGHGPQCTSSQLGDRSFTEFLKFQNATEE